MIDLDHLESLAKGAEWTGRWYYAGCNTVECKYPPSTHNYAGQVDEIAHPVPLNVAEFIAAANPSAIIDLCAEVRRLRERSEGPGTPSARLSYLLRELEALLPGVVNPLSSEPPETKLIDAVRRLRTYQENARKQFYELEGVSIDATQGHGFDDTCLDTIKRVQRVLVAPDDAKPDCSCEACRPLTMTDMRMVLCETCGNKRCPHATNHRNACTGSNEVGQKGSSWEHVKPLGEGRP
jgi:hypothetical protein